MALSEIEEQMVRSTLDPDGLVWFETRTKNQLEHLEVDWHKWMERKGRTITLPRYLVYRACRSVQSDRSWDHITLLWMGLGLFLLAVLAFEKMGWL